MMDGLMLFGLGSTFAATLGMGVMYLKARRDIRNAADHLNMAATIFEGAPTGMVITDCRGVILDVNAAFEALTGFCKDEVIGKTPAILKSGRQTQEFYEAMWSAIKVEGHWSGEVWNCRKNGEEFAEHLTITAVFGASGEISHYVGVITDVTKIKEHEQTITMMAAHDALTQLPNRAKLYELMRHSIMSAQRAEKMMAVVFIDLDGFKPINDTHGDAAGDVLLIAVAQRLKACLRDNDTVARLGGDEFVVLLSNVRSRRECRQTVTRMMTALGDPIHVCGDASVEMTASVGIALFPQDEGDADTLLRHANQAMFQAKQEGKNRYHFFNPSEGREQGERSKLLTRFTGAIDNNELVLFYQPKVDMWRGDVIGMEALIRWQHPEQGLLPPGEFLPVVENSSVAIRMGYWVIESALRQMTAWRDLGITIGVSVNIPGTLLLHETFVQRVKTLLTRYSKVDAGMLQMEILESVALENIADASSVIHQCKQLGVTFALDDFGTGYASLTYLKRLGIDVLKIDQSFVRNMIHDVEDLAIVDGVTSLSEAFNRTVVAEGVETIEHGSILLRLGCRYGQGYGIARPMSAKDVPDWLARWTMPTVWQRIPRWSRENIPLLEAEINHRKWMQSIEQALSETDMKSFAPEGSDTCKFGKWLASPEANPFRSHHHFIDVVRTHRETHRLGSHVISLAKEGEREHAQVELANLRAYRDALVGMLHEMANEHGVVESESVVA